MAVFHVLLIDERVVAEATDPEALGSALLESLREIRPDHEPAPPQGTGFLANESLPVELHTTNVGLLHWSRGALAPYWPERDVAEIEGLLDFGGSTDPDVHPVSMIVVDSEHGLGAASDLGRGLIVLARQPRTRGFNEGHTELRRDARVAWADEQILVCERGVVWPARRLSPAQRAGVITTLSQPLSAPRKEPPAPDAPPVLCGVDLLGNEFDSHIRLGPGRVVPIFGPNGAGKSLALDALSVALRKAVGADLQPTRPATPPARLFFDAVSQDRAPHLFSTLLLHLGWSPWAHIPDAVRRDVTEALPVWDGTDDPPAGSNAVPPLLAAERPPGELRTLLLRAMSERAAWAPRPDGSALLAAFLQSAMLTLDDQGHVALAVDPTTRSDLTGAARSFRDWAHQTGLALLELERPVFELANALLDGRDRPVVGPRVLLTTHVEYLSPEEPPWLAASQSLLDQLAPAVPTPVAFDPWPESALSAEARVEDRLRALLRKFRSQLRPDEPFPPAPDPTAPHEFHDALAQPLADLLADRATALLPAFVRRTSRLRVKVLQSEYWHQRRCRVALVDDDDVELPIEDAPAGMRTWAHAALGFALAQLEVSKWGGTSTRFGPFVWEPENDDVWLSDETSRLGVNHQVLFEDIDPASFTPASDRAQPLIFLLDEPEAHLHMTAQSDVVDVVVGLATVGGGAVVATHSLAFLDAREAVTPVLASRTGGKHHITASTGLSGLVAQADELGVPPATFAMSVRGVLAVEGINDAAMLRQYGGVDLDRAHVHLAVLQGRNGAPNLIEIEFLHSLRIPVAVLLDHVRRSRLVEAIDAGSTSGLTGEEQLLVALGQSLLQNRVRVAVVPFAPVDIALAVPDEEISWAIAQLGGRTFEGWATLKPRLDEAWTRDRVKFKDAFLQAVGIDVDRILRVLRTSGRQRESAVLKAALSSAVNYFAQPENEVGLKILKPSQR